MTESEFMMKAVKAGHRAADMLSITNINFDEELFIFQSSIHMAYLAEEIFDKKGEKDEV